jgi:DNA-binding NtrC family response regulator
LSPDTGAAAVGEGVAAAAEGRLVLDEPGALPASGQAALAALLEDEPALRLVSTARARPEGLRDDLLAALATVEIHLPPLATRGEDLILLSEHFVRLFSRRHGRAPRPLDASALEALRLAPPPGEVRGLRQAIERAVVLGAEDVITAADLAPAGAPAASLTEGPDLNLARSEKAIVEAALKRHAHNVSQAARELGLTRAALYRRMVKHGL